LNIEYSKPSNRKAIKGNRQKEAKINP